MKTKGVLPVDVLLRVALGIASLCTLHSEVVSAAPPTVPRTEEAQFVANYCSASTRTSIPSGSDAQARKKVNSLMRYFTTQQNKQWFSEDLFYGLMRLRATEAASPTRYAEAFYCRKALLGTVN